MPINVASFRAEDMKTMAEKLTLDMRGWGGSGIITINPRKKPVSVSGRIKAAIPALSDTVVRTFEQHKLAVASLAMAQGDNAENPNYTPPAWPKIRGAVRNDPQVLASLEQGFQYTADMND